jgi:hypothetical protein
MKYQSSSKHLIPIVVGVTGHRDLREEDIPELEKKVGAIFKEIKLKYQDKYQRLPITILSPLADGADMLVAQVGLHADHADIKLTAVLPMPKKEYEKDFDTAESKRAFADLLEKAEDVFELPFVEGNTLEIVQRCRESRNKQYALAGAYIAAHSQILIALWDGRDASETASVVRAKLEGIPGPSAPKATGETAKVVRAKLEGIPGPSASPESPLDILDNGPVYHVFTRRKNTPAEIVAHNHEPEIQCLLHVKGKWDVLYPIIWNSDKHALHSSDKGKSSNNKSRESVHPPPLTPPTRGGGNSSSTQIGETFPPPVPLTEGEKGGGGRPGGGAELLQSKNNKPEEAAEKYYDSVLKRISEFNRDIMKNCKNEDALNTSISYVMPESEQEKLSPGLRKILAYYGYADTLALYYQKITTDVLKRLLITAVASFFFFNIFDQFWAKAYILALFPIIMGIGYLFYKIAVKKDYENKYYDYRALAEGLRVQFFWKLMRSKENTYDRYLRKYRGDMDWIFQTIRNVCINANQEISQNPSLCKKEELEILQRCWLKDQESYFVKTSPIKERKIRRQEKATLCFFCAAMATVLGFFIVKAVVAFQHGSLKDFINMEDIQQGIVYYPFAFLIDVFLAIGAALAIYVEKRAFADELKQYQRMMVLYSRANRFMEEYIAKNNITGAENLAIELGKEALIENGDWYIIQRSKPLEPFLG